GFRRRYSLHPMGSRLELQPGIDAFALHPRDDLLVAALLAVAGADHLDLPALLLGIAGIHAEQVAGEQRRLVAAGAGTDLEEDVAAVVRVARYQQTLEPRLQLIQAFAPFAQLQLRQFA